MFQSQREDGYIPAARGWHLHQPALCGRPPARHELMWSPGDIRNRFVMQEQTERDRQYDLTFNLTRGASSPYTAAFFRSQQRLISTLDLLQTESSYRFGFVNSFCAWFLPGWTNQVSLSNKVMWLLHITRFTWTERLIHMVWKLRLYLNWCSYIESEETFSIETLW